MTLVAPAKVLVAVLSRQPYRTTPPCLVGVEMPDPGEGAAVTCFGPEPSDCERVDVACMLAGEGCDDGDVCLAAAKYALPRDYAWLFIVDGDARLQKDDLTGLLALTQQQGSLSMADGAICGTPEQMAAVPAQWFGAFCRATRRDDGYYAGCH